MNEGTIVKNVEISTLDLSIPNIQSRIYSARDAPRPPPIIQDEKPKKNPRFNRNQKVEVKPGEIPYSQRSEGTINQDHVQQSKFLSQLKKDQNFIKNISEKIDTYNNSRHAKQNAREKDYLDHFYTPLQRRLQEQMSPHRYKAFLKQKEKAIQDMDKNPVPIRSNRDLPHVPTISVSAQGLSDPAKRFVSHQRGEDQLSCFIMKSNNQSIKKPKKPKRDSLNFNKLKYEHQTRFYYGVISDHPHGNSFGRRCYEDATNSSRTAYELSYFPS